MRRAEFRDENWIGTDGNEIKGVVAYKRDETIYFVLKEMEAAK